MGGGHFRIRSRARIGSQLGLRFRQSRPVQALHRVDRGGHPARGASHPPQPRDPGIGHCYNQIGNVHLLQSRIEKAIVWLEKARSAMPGVPIFRSRLAAAYALRGETERAAAELAEARRLNKDLFSSIARLKAGRPWGVPKIHALFEATYFTGLRKAGMPEE